MKRGLKKYLIDRYSLKGYSSVKIVEAENSFDLQCHVFVDGAWNCVGYVDDVEREIEQAKYMRSISKQ